MDKSIVVLQSGILNVDTVQERSQILILDHSWLLNTGAALRNFLKVNTLEGQVVLFFFFTGDQDSFRGIDSFVDLETQEVLDFKSFTIIEDVDNDREMGVGENHLELVAYSDTLDHVSDNAADSAQHCVSLLFLKPHAESDTSFVSFFGLFLWHLEGDVLEALGEFTKWAFDGDSSSLDLDFNSGWDFEFLLWDDVLHYLRRVATNIIIKSKYSYFHSTV